MPLASDKFVDIPTRLHVVLWCEMILFAPFAFMHYVGPFKSMWGAMSTNPITRAALWTGEMLNGVGAWVLMYMIASTLYEQKVSLIEVEILLLSHALWLGVILSFAPPAPALPAGLLLQPHVWLSTAVVATAYDMPRPVCWVLSGAILAFAIFRRKCQYPQACFGKPSVSLQDCTDALREIDCDETRSGADMIERVASPFMCLGERGKESTPLKQDPTTVEDAQADV